MADNSFRLRYEARKHLGGDSIPLVTAVLNALHVIMDETALPLVVRLAASEKPTALDPDVRTAALAILPILRELEANKSGKQTLLRASSVDTTIADTALRPVVQRNAVDPELLLRTTESDS